MIYFVVVQRFYQGKSYRGLPCKELDSVDIQTAMDLPSLIDALARQYIYAVDRKMYEPEVLFVGRLSEICASEYHGLPVDFDNPDGEWTYPPDPNIWFHQNVVMSSRVQEHRAEAERLQHERDEQARKAAEADKEKRERELYERLREKFETGKLTSS